jgi:hypothetical protein
MATINHKTYNEATETFKDFNVYDGKETLIFKVDGSEGNVGIGNSSPTATLDITGTLAVSGNSTFDTTTLVVDAAGDRVILGAAASLEGDTIEIHAKPNAGAISLFGRASDNGSAVSFRSNGATTQKAQIYGSDAGLGFATGTTQRVLIDTSGNVGIGTSSPSQLLHINASSGAVYTRVQNNVNSLYLGVESGGIAQVSSDASSLKVMATTFTSFETAAAERMRITSTGAVGIGTTSPATKLDVAFPSDGTAGAVFGYTGGTNNPRIFFNVNESTSKGQIIMSGSSGALDLGIGAGGTEIITLKGTGNVGIGTTSPTSLLNLSSATPILTLNQNTANSEQGIEFDTSDVNYAFIRANAVTGLVSYAAGLTGGAGYVHRFIVDGSERLRITPNGLTFNGDTAAANALDDYEEGTWTPQISNGTTNVAISNSYSTYTKIGRQVTVNTRMVNGDLSSFSSGDNISFIGLPFTSGGDYYSTIYVRGAVSGNLVRLLAIGNGTTTAATDLFVSELVDGASDYWFTATYFV